MNCIIIADKHDKGNKSKGWSGAQPINRKTILVNNQINVIRSCFPKSKITYIYGFDCDKVEQHFENNIKQDKITLIYNQHYEDYGEIFSISRAKSLLDEDILLFFGNLILKPSVFQNFTKNRSHIFTNNKNYNELGCMINSKGKIEHVCYELENYLEHIYYISKSDIDVFRSIVSRFENRNCFIFEVINKMIERGVTFYPKELNKKNILSTIN